MVKRRPISDQGATQLRKTRSYQDGLKTVRRVNLVNIAAPNGIPRNTATLVATVA